MEKAKVMRISRQQSAVLIVVDQKLLETVACFSGVGSLITNGARCAFEIKSRIVVIRASFNKKKTHYTSRVDVYLRKKLVKCYIWNTALCGAETWTRRRVDQKYLESFEMWCWRRMEKISWTDRVKNEEVLHRVTEQRNIVHTIKKTKANRIGHSWRRNCLLKDVIEGAIEGSVDVTGRRGRRRKQLLDDLKETRGYWKLKEEALDRTLWRTRFGSDCGSVCNTDCGMNGFTVGCHFAEFGFGCLRADGEAGRGLKCFAQSGRRIRQHDGP